MIRAMPTPSAPTTPAAASSTKVHRIEVPHPKPGRLDPRAKAVQRKAARVGLSVTDARSAKVYLIEAPLSEGQVATIAGRLLADPTTTTRGRRIPSPVDHVGSTPTSGCDGPNRAESRQGQIAALVGDTAVVTGVRFDLQGLTAAQAKNSGREGAGESGGAPTLHHVHPAALPHRAARTP